MLTDLETQVETWTQQGLDSRWLTSHKGIICLTQAYFEARGQVPPVKAPSDYKERYLQFIKEATVPYRLPIGNKGDTYTVNSFSTPGMQAFAKCLKTPGMDYHRLVQATKAHYADSRATRKTLTRYFVESWWVSVYEDYKGQMATSNQPLGIEL